jgi:hypothetical protein
MLQLQKLIPAHDSRTPSFNKTRTQRAPHSSTLPTMICSPKSNQSNILYSLQQSDQGMPKRDLGFLSTSKQNQPWPLGPRKARITKKKRRGLENTRALA